MATYDPSPADETAAQQAKIRTQKLALLKAEGLQPNTPDSVIEQMLKILDPADLHATLSQIKAKWQVYFGGPRSADRIAAQTLRK